MTKQDVVIVVTHQPDPSKRGQVVTFVIQVKAK